MSNTRYALLGLGRARAAWFGDVALWSTSGALAAEFSKCLSVAEVRLRLSSLQPYSALLVEAGTPGLDRNLIDLARRSGTVTVVIDSAVSACQDWAALGAATVLPTPLSPTALTDALRTHAAAVTAQSEQVVHQVNDDNVATSTGHLIAVCGPGGTGASTLATAIAQGFASDPLDAELVVLADFTRNAEQAMLHDAPDLVPGVEELVDAHRSRRPSNEDVRSLTFGFTTRAYRLLLGQRRRGAWSAMPPRAIETSLDSLRRTFRVTVADITADFESETEGGSLDVEERNALSRLAARNADVVVAVGAPGVKGTHSLGRVVRELIATGVQPERILAVVNNAPRRALERLAFTRALGAVTDGVDIAAPIFVAVNRQEIPQGFRQTIPHPDQLLTLLDGSPCCHDGARVARRFCSRWWTEGWS